MSRLWPWQQRGLYWNVSDYDKKRCHYCAGSSFFFFFLHSSISLNQIVFLQPLWQRIHPTSTCICFSVTQRKDFPSNSFYVVVVVKTEDEACGGPLRFYPLQPDKLIDAGNRTKDLDVVVFPAINCKYSTSIEHRSLLHTWAKAGQSLGGIPLEDDLFWEAPLLCKRPLFAWPEKETFLQI